LALSVRTAQKSVYPAGKNLFYTYRLNRVISFGLWFTASVVSGNKMSFRQHTTLVLFLALMAFSSESAQRLYVFLPTTAQPRVIQNKLCSLSTSVTVTVFGRYLDFAIKVQRDAPEAILVKPLVVEKIGGYQIKQFGYINGSSTEPFVLLSIGEKVEPAALKDKTIGIVDFLGNDGMEQFVSQLLKAAPQIKRVNKIEDLLPQLILNLCNVVCIPQSQVAFFRQASKMTLYVNQIPDASVGIAAVAVHKGVNAPEVIKIIKECPDDINMLFGVTEWK
jgi:hypothetical protein